MSAIPQRTQILVKDLLFQKKYHLSHSQTDLMAYFVNVLYWAINVDGYFVIATSKIMTDLPEMGQKTIEASLKVLKDSELIECKIVKVNEWKGKPNIRGMRLTQKGAEYNAKIVLPNQDKKVIALTKRIKELEATVERLTVSTEKPTRKDTPNPKEPTSGYSNPKTEAKPSDSEFAGFVKVMKQEFGASSEPICNFVPSWLKETTFYINNYNRLSIITPKGEYKQLSDPIQVNRFWQWLFKHQNRVGKVIDFAKPLDLKELKERYLGIEMVLAKTEFTIEDLVAVEKGVKIRMRNKTNNKIGFAMDSKSKKEAVFALGDCEAVILKCRKS